MLPLPRTRTFQGLVIWYGLVQALHLIALIRAAVILIRTGAIPFPAPPPAGGGARPVYPFLIGMGGLDSITIIAALIFVFGYFTGRPQSVWPGAASLTALTYSALLFAVGTIANGAWQAHPYAYGALTLAFAPVAFLFIRINLWMFRPR